MGFAGLWDIWINPEGERIESCTIITTAANEVIQPLHDRMPLIVSPDAYDVWLAGNVNGESKQIDAQIKQLELQVKQYTAESGRMDSETNRMKVIGDLLTPEPPTPKPGEALP